MEANTDRLIRRQNVERYCRLRSFLLEIPVSNGNTIELLMTRQDIGEYLGLTVESVSRTFAHLEATAAIDVHFRQIVLRSRASLRRLNA